MLMRVLVGATKGTQLIRPCGSCQISHQAILTERGIGQAHVSAIKTLHNPIYEAMKDATNSRLGRNKSCVGQAEKSVLRVRQLTHLK